MKLKGLNMSDREKNLLLAGLLVVLLVAFYFYTYQPTNFELKGLQRDLAEAQARLSELKLIAKDSTDFDKQIEASRKEMEAVEKKLPTGGDDSELIRLLEREAKLAKVDIITLKLDDTADKGDYTAFLYVIGVKGDYFDIIRYCEGLEKSSRILDLNGWKMEKDDQGALVASITFEAYGGKGKKLIPEREVKVLEQERNPFI